MAEDLLVNIEVDSKKARRGVDDLSKSLKENAKQSKKIQDELKKLEKEYKSIATAAKKLPTNELTKLTKEVKKTEKVTAQMGRQFDRTSKRVEKVKDRISGTEVAAVALIATMRDLGSLNAPIKFAGRITMASNAMDNLINTTVPAIKEVRRLGSEGFARMSKISEQASAAVRSFGPAMREQVQIMRGYQHVMIRTVESQQEFTKLFKLTGSAAEFFKRGMVGAQELVVSTQESIGRLKTFLRGLQSAFRETASTVNNFRAVFFGTFGAGSGGAAQVSKFQQLILELQYGFEIAQRAAVKFATTGLVFISTQMSKLGAVISTVAKDTSGKLLTSMGALAKSGVAKTFELLQLGLTKAGPAIITLAGKIQNLSVAFDKNFAASVAKSFSAATSFGVKTLDMSKNLGVVGKGLIGAAESATVFGAGLFALGSILKSTDNALLDFIGSVVQTVGLVSLSLGAAITIAVGAVGRLAVAIGDKLIGVMDQWEQKFVKAQTTTRAFEFVIQGFGRTLGVEAVGSLQFWNQETEKLIQNTAIGATEIQKSIKILVAEGAVLGISAAQNAQVLQRAADIAESSKRPLSEVSLAFAKALAGTAGALDSVGIFTDKATLAHSHYAKSSKLVIDKLDKQQKAQLVMNSIFEQSEARIGAAADQLNTVSGATAQYAAAVENLQAKLGSQNILFTKLTQVQTAFVNVLNDLPTALIDTVSILVDVAGVGLKVVGTFLTLVFTIATVHSAYTGLNFILGKSQTLQLALNFVVGVAAKKLAIQTVAITNLKTAMIAFSQVTVAGTKFALNQFITAITAAAARAKAFTIALFFTAAGWKAMIAGSVAATKAIWAFTASLLRNPLFLKAAFLVGGILAVVQALKQMNEQLTALNPPLKETSKQAKASAGFFKMMGDFAKGAFQLVVDFTKLALVGLMSFVKVAHMAAKGFELVKTAVFGSKEEMKKVQGEADQIKKDFVNLATVGQTSMDNISKVFSSTAQAAEDTGKAINSMFDSEKLRGFSDALRNTFDEGSIAIQVMGDEVDRTLEQFIIANTQLNSIRDKFAQGGANAPKQGDVTSAGIDRERARLAVIKLRQDAIKNLSDTIRALNMDELEAQGKLVEVARRKGALDLASFRERIKSLGKIAAFSKEEKILIGRVEEGIKAVTAADMQRAQAKIDEKKTKELKEQAKLLKELGEKVQELNIANLEGAGETFKLAKAQYALQLKDLSVLEQRLKAANLLTTANQEILDTARKLAKEKLDELTPFTVGDMLSVLDEFVKSGEDMIKDMFAFDFKGTFNSLANSVKGFGSRILNADDMAGEFGKAFAEMDIAGLTENLGDSLNEAFMKVDLKTVGEGMLEGLTQGGALTMQLFDPSSIGSLSDTIQNLIVDFPKNLAEAFSKLDQVLGKVIDSLPEAMIKIVDSLPGIIQKILDKLPEFIVALAGALNKFLEQLPFLVGRILEALPDIIATLLQQLPELILNLLNAVGKIAAKLIQEIPNILVSILENLPDIIMAIVEGLIASMGDVVAAFVDFFIGGGLEKIVVALIKAIPKIAVALVNGFINGIKRALGSIFGGIDIAEPINELATKFTEGFNSLTAKASEEASKLFKVLDLEAAAKGLDQAQRITDAINQGISNFVFAFKGLFQWLGDVWGKIIQFVKDAFNTIIKAFEDIFRWIGELFMQIVEGIRAIFQWVIDKVFTPIAELVKKAFQWVIDKILTPLGSVVKKAFEGIGDLGKKLWEAFKTGFEANLDIFKKAGTAIWGALKAGFDGIGNLFGKIFNTSGAWGKGTVENALNIDIPFLKFAEGGKVPGAASVPGDSIKNDKVMAMLSPGEFVVPRSIMANPILKKMVENIAGGNVSFLFGGTLGKIAEGDIDGAAGDIGNAGKKAIGDLAEFLGGVDPWEFIKDKVFNEMIMKMLAKNRFHSGGMVPAFANGGEVPAMLQSGEFVINRSAVNAIGAANLGRINRGQMSGGDTEYNFDIKMSIQNKGDMDEGFIRQRLIPTVKKELKNASLRGEFLISQRGIRET